MRLSLSNEEKTILYWKYRNSGLTSEQANEKLNKIKKHLRNLVLNLMKKKKSKKYIEIRFKQEFINLLNNYS